VRVSPLIGEASFFQVPDDGHRREESVSALYSIGREKRGFGNGRDRTLSNPTSVDLVTICFICAAEPPLDARHRVCAAHHDPSKRLGLSPAGVWSEGGAADRGGESLGPAVSLQFTDCETRREPNYVTVYPVRLSENALAAIEQEWFDTACDYFDQGVVEFGGWLWCRQDADWEADGVEIIEACGAGPGAEKSYNSMVLPTGHMLDLDLLFRSEGLQLCGGFHSHPSGTDQPSEKDFDRIGAVINLRRIWGCHMEKALELILTPRPESGFSLGSSKKRFRPWQITPWVFYEGEGSLGSVGIWPEPTYLEKGESSERL
jgi:hypothetical protein